MSQLPGDYDEYGQPTRVSYGRPTNASTQLSPPASGGAPSEPRFRTAQASGGYDGSGINPDGRYGGGPVAPAPSSGDWDAVERRLREAAGNLYDPSDLEGIRRNTSYTDAAGNRTGLSLDQALASQMAIYNARRAPTGWRAVDSQSAEGNALYGSGTGNGLNIPGGPMAGGSAKGSYPPFLNSSPQFGDASSRLVEDYALDRFRQRQNPDPNSGTARFEEYLRKFADTLQGSPYSPTEESQIKQTAYNAIEGERAATKQRWVDEMSRRGIPQTSGIYLEGLKSIDNHYGRVRAEADNSFATNAINLTRANRAQAASVLGSLASNEEGRLSDALTYAMLPLSLQDRAFNQGLALTGAAGQYDSRGPLGILQMLQQANQVNSANRAQNMNAIMQYLASLYG